MKLIYDDLFQIWVWTISSDRNHEISPRFSDKADADNWLQLITELLHQPFSTDPYGNIFDDSWEEQDPYAQDGFDLQTQDRASNIAELDNKMAEEMQDNHTPSFDGGTFNDDIPSVLKTFSSMNNNHDSSAKPDHPDMHEDGIPESVKALVGQTRIRGNLPYEITAVAGPIKGTKGNHTGRWALYIKDKISGIEDVFDMESILKDQNLDDLEKQISQVTKSGDTKAINNLTADILRLAHEWTKNARKQSDNDKPE